MRLLGRSPKKAVSHIQGRNEHGTMKNSDKLVFQYKSPYNNLKTFNYYDPICVVPFSSIIFSLLVLVILSALISFFFFTEQIHSL